MNESAIVAHCHLQMLEEGSESEDCPVQFHDTASMGKNLLPLARWQWGKSYGCDGQSHLPVWLAVTRHKGCNRQTSDSGYQDHIQSAPSAGQVTHKWGLGHGAYKDLQSWLYRHRWMRSRLFGATALPYEHRTALLATNSCCVSKSWRNRWFSTCVGTHTSISPIWCPKHRPC